MSKEFEPADLAAAAKAFGCEGQLKYELAKRAPIKVSAIENPLVTQALTGSVSFSPEDHSANRHSYEGVFGIHSRRRGFDSHDKEQSALRRMMTNKPNSH